MTEPVVLIVIYSRTINRIMCNVIIVKSTEKEKKVKIVMNIYCKIYSKCKVTIRLVNTYLITKISMQVNHS